MRIPSNPTMFRALRVVAVPACAAGAITACNAVAADGGAARLVLGVALLVVGLVCFGARHLVRR
jgi:hypothetical protein